MALAKQRTSQLGAAVLHDSVVRMAKVERCMYVTLALLSWYAFKFQRSSGQDQVMKLTIEKPTPIDARAHGLAIYIVDVERHSSLIEDEQDEPSTVSTSPYVR